MHRLKRNSFRHELFLVLAVLVASLSVLEVHGAVSSTDNVDRLEPIVRRSPALAETGDDLFGFAAVLHQIQVLDSQDDETEAATKTRIIIGAPRGTYPGGLGLPDLGRPKEIQTGLVYSCPIVPGQCEGVRGDTSLYFNEATPDVLDNDLSIYNNDIITDVYPSNFTEGRLFDQAPNAILYARDVLDYFRFENKTGQLLGATLFSNGDTFIACAPRWTYTNGQRNQAQPRGICYTSGRNLRNFELLYPCSTLGERSIRVDMENYCTAGKSAIPYDNYFIIGAPLFSGTGALYYSSSASPTVFNAGNIVQLDQNGMPDASIVDQYQGFSTVSAFISMDRTSALPPNVVTAVPRYDGDTYQGRVNVYNPPNFSSIQNSILASGSQMGEFFGHSMIAIDLNNDRFDDLVVGAPMNTDYERLIIERGSIYVFFNNGAGSLMPGTMLPGTVAGARFGTSLANLGDINRDGYEDFAVGAPYYIANGGSSSGVVYLYYGNADMNAFLAQQPFKIRAEEIVDRVGSSSSLSELRTFGWTISGGVDVDNNMYNDLVIGAYETQTVVVLRTLPVVTVTVDIMMVAEVDLNSSFTVTVAAQYAGVGVPGPLTINFTLHELMTQQGSSPRLSFQNGGMGSFMLTGPGNMATAQVTVTPLLNTTSLDPYMLQLELQDIDRPVRSDVDGNQTLESLASFPRLVQAGEDTEMVTIRDPCLDDGVNGCQSDVMLHPPNANITVTAGGNVYHTVDLLYQHVSGDDAVGLNLTFSNLDPIIEAVRIKRANALSDTTCSAIIGGSATCRLQPRLQKSDMDTVTLNFTVNQAMVVGSEPPFAVDVEVVSSTDNPNDNDTNTANNGQQVVFNVNASADLSVESLSFGGDTFIYSGIRPEDPIRSAASLGQSVSLSINIRNSGPTIIRQGSLDISIPFKYMMDSEFTLLYPTRIDDTGPNSLNGIIECDNRFVDPEDLVTTSSQVGDSRRRRRMARAARRQDGGLKRVARQEQMAQETRVVNCSGADANTAMCTLITCTISNLRRGLFSVSIFTRVDNRFFADQTANFNLTASAYVSVNGSFYRDDPNNNNGAATVRLIPMPPEVEGESGQNLIHFILWPCIGGLLLLILVAVLLYFLGFFRRKKKPEDDEAEGDFDVDQYKLQGGAEGGAKGGAEGKPPLESDETTTKV